MSQILLITSSPRSATSYSSRVARSLAEKLAAGEAHPRITVRDLTGAPIPHIDDTFAEARNLPPGSLTAEQRAALRLSDSLLAELSRADVIIIAAGMINFGIPSALKAYIDHIVRPGVTFKYSERGPEGLVKGKKVYLVMARGGIYSDGPMRAFNFQDTYLKAALGFIGLTDIEVIAIEGVAFGPEAAEKAMAIASAKVAALADALTPQNMLAA
jgi:FMN-dependent NADH-azoreductase